MAATFPSFESRTVQLDRIVIHYLLGGAGAPVVLVHGLGSSAGVEFRYNLEALAAEHRVYAVDLPGFGDSDKPPVDYSIPFFVSVLRSFFASQGLTSASVIGVSMGGRVALGFALEAPLVVDRLVLVDSLGMGAPRRVFAYTVLLAKGLGELALSGTARALRRLDPRLIRRLWGWYLRRPGGIDQILSDERIADQQARLATPAYRAAYLSALRSIADVRRLRSGVVVESRLRELTMPTLLVWGRHDHVFPASHAEAARALIPRAQIAIFEDSGHTPQVEEPDRFNRLVLDFLQP